MKTQVHDDGTASWKLTESPSGLSPFEDAAKREARGVMNVQPRVLSELLVDSDSPEPCSLAFADILELSGAQTGTIFTCGQSGSCVQLLDKAGPVDRDLWIEGYCNLFRPDGTDAASKTFSDPEDPESTVLTHCWAQCVTACRLL